MWTFRISSVVVLPVKLLLLAAWLAASAHAQTSPPADRLPLSILPQAENLATLPLLYIRAAGLFDKVGLDVKWLPVTTNATQVAAMVDTGQVDLAQSTVSAALTSQAVGKDVVCFAMVSKGSFYQLILTNDAVKKLPANVTAKSSPAEKLNAIKGLKIMLPVAGTTTDLTFRSLLEKFGINPDKDVALIPNADLNSLPATARAGRVDGYFNGPPITSIAIGQGWGQNWLDLTVQEVPINSDAPQAVMIAKRATLASKAEAFKRVIEAMKIALRDIRERPDVVKTAVKQRYYENIDDKTYTIAFESAVKIFDHDMKVSDKGYQQIVDSLTIVNLEGKPVKVPYDKVFEFTLLK